MHPVKSFWDWLFIRHCYRASFPANERKPLSIIYQMWKKGRTDVWIYWHADKRIGFASTINSPDCILLDYFAISPHRRNQRLGSSFLQKLNAQYADKGLFVEIEYAASVADDTDIVRRKKFYLRNGMQPMSTYASVFGVPMELLGYRCQLDFDAYHAFYANHYSMYAANHIIPLK